MNTRIISRPSKKKEGFPLIYRHATQGNIGVQPCAALTSFSANEQFRKKR